MKQDSHCPKCVRPMHRVELVDRISNRSKIFQCETCQTVVSVEVMVERISMFNSNPDLVFD
uniref:Uncharacterized protein n=1 Tax=Rhodopseudomonas palustris (strain DX-1) TaxID=652103 RepID=E6VPI3_RHOPX